MTKMTIPSPYLSVFSFPINLMEKLKVGESNNILNETEFIQLIGEDSLKELKLTHDKFCETLGVGGDFYHAFWTLMINAGKNSSNFNGMHYGCLCSTLYINNSSSSLIEIGITLPKYQTILWEPEPKQYETRRCEMHEIKNHITNPVIQILREGFMNGVIGDTENVWQNNWWTGNPFGKNFSDFKVTNARNSKQKSNIKYTFDEIKTKGKIFKKHLVTYNYATDFHIITINDKIAFITNTSSKCIDAFELLTGVQDIEYDTKKGVRVYKTKEKTFEYKKHYFDDITYLHEVIVVTN